MKNFTRKELLRERARFKVGDSVTFGDFMTYCAVLEVHDRGLLVWCVKHNTKHFVTYDGNNRRRDGERGPIIKAGEQ